MLGSRNQSLVDMHAKVEKSILWYNSFYLKHKALFKEMFKVLLRKGGMA